MAAPPLPPPPSPPPPKRVAVAAAAATVAAAADRVAAAAAAVSVAAMPTVGELKKSLKAVGLAQTGEKPDLERRLRQHGEGESLKLDGVNPAALKNPALKKACAKRGLPCDLDLGTRDDLVDGLIASLKAEARAAGSSSNNNGGDDESDEPLSKKPRAGGASSSDDGDELAIGIAKQVLQLGEGGQVEAVLSVLGEAITRATPFAKQKRAYLQLARLIHPDKLGGKYDGATRAFQELVRAFDTLTAPEVVEDDAPAAPTAKTLARSNENCVRTRVFCPRCRAEWGTADSGLQPYDYTIFMQGLKTYCCALCLCDFGCMSAIHKCPICTKDFEYTTHDYHRQVSCGNARCTRTFGFHLYFIQPRVEAQLRADIRVEQEAKMKAREAAAARLARAQRKAPQASESEKRAQAERLFVLGLLDCCPRCGAEMAAGSNDEESRGAHLKACVDAKAHAAHAKAEAAAAAVAGAKAARRDAQEEAQNEAAWKFLGGDTGSMWLLTDKQLGSQLELHGLDGGGSREEKLARLARHRMADQGNLLTDGSGGGGSGGGGGGKVRVSAASLPSNLHSMSLAQLRAVCASHGLVAKGETTDDIIRQLEGATELGKVLMLEEKPPPKPRAKSVAAEPDSSDDDAKPDDSSDEDVPLSQRAGKKA